MTGGLRTLGETLRCTDRHRIAAAGLLMVLFAAATPGAAAEDGAEVVVTIKPIHSLVSRVIDGVGTPLLLVDGNASPHNFALRPSQVRASAKAAVFIRVSERLEPFTGKLVRALPESVAIVTLIDAPGVKLLKQRHNGTFVGHADDDGHADDVTDKSGGADSHIWLDPDNAKAIGNYVAEVLSARFPAHAGRFKANAERLGADIDALSKDLTAETEPLRDKPFVVFHDAYQYFDRRFDLDAAGSITVSPDVQPSAKRLIELRQNIRDLKAVCVFAEPLFQAKLVAALTEDTNARAGTLDPEGLGLEPGPRLYFLLMRNLAAALKDCLAPAR